MAGSYNAGIVTAYGAAVRGGYTGTYEQFCAQQANYAQTAAAVEQAKTDAQAAAQRAQDVADSIPEDYTELTEEVGDLKDDITHIEDDIYSDYSLTYLIGAYIPIGSVGIGNTVSIVGTYNGGYGFVVCPCKKGDKFVLTAKGGENSRVWAFTDDNLILLSCAGADQTVTDLELTAPDNGFFISNAYIYLTYSAVKKVASEQKTYGTDITNFTDGSYIGIGNYSLGDTVSLTPISNGSYSHMIIPCSAGDRFKVTCKGGSASRVYGFVNESNVLIVYAAADTTVTDIELTAPADGKLILNGYIYMTRSVSTISEVSTLELVESIQEELDSRPWNNHPWEFVVPQKLRVGVGIEMNVYLQNIIRYFNADNAQIINFTNNSLAYYKKFSRYIGTANKADFSAQAQLYYDNTNEPFMLSSSMTVHTVPASAGSGTTKKVMLIGDSLTDADATSGELVTMFNDDVMNIELVGTLGTAPNLNEGRAGWRAYTYAKCARGSDDVASLAYTNPFYNPSTQQFDFNYYMTQNGFSGIDYVFICLGTNDLGASNHTSDADILSYYDIMINSIHSYDSNIKIGLWLPPTRSLYANNNRKAIDFSLRMNKLLISTYGTSESNKIYLVPVYLNVDPEHDYNSSEVPISSRNTNYTMEISIDAVHPAVVGYKKIADVIYSYIKFFAE